MAIQSVKDSTKAWDTSAYERWRSQIPDDHIFRYGTVPSWRNPEKGGAIESVLEEHFGKQGGGGYRPSEWYDKESIVEGKYKDVYNDWYREEGERAFDEEGNPELVSHWTGKTKAPGFTSRDVTRIPWISDPDNPEGGRWGSLHSPGAYSWKQHAHDLEGWSTANDPLTNASGWTPEQVSAGEKAFWTAPGERVFGWNWISRKNQNEWIRQAMGASLTGQDPARPAERPKAADDLAITKPGETPQGAQQAEGQDLFDPAKPSAKARDQMKVNVARSKQGSNKSMTLAERLKQAGSAVRDWEGFIPGGPTMGEKIQNIADIPSNLSTAVQAVIPFAQSLAHGAGWDQGGDKNPMKINLLPSVSNQRRDLANQYLNSLDPAALAEIKRSGELTNDQLTALNKAINTGRQGTEGGTVRNELDPWRMTMNNLASRKIDIEDDPTNPGQVRATKVYDNYQFDSDTDVSFASRLLTPIVKAAPAINRRLNPNNAKMSITGELPGETMAPDPLRVKDGFFESRTGERTDTRRLPTYHEFTYKDQPPTGELYKKSQQQVQASGSSWDKYLQRNVMQIPDIAQKPSNMPSYVYESMQRQIGPHRGYGNYMIEDMKNIQQWNQGNLRKA